jgi:hypothetical protein
VFFCLIIPTLYSLSEKLQNFCKRKTEWNI